MDGCIVYTGIRLLLLLICPFILIFVSLQSSIIQYFLQTFFMNCETSKLKRSIHVSNGWMYRVDQNQIAAVYLSFYFFLLLFPIFKH